MSIDTDAAAAAVRPYAWLLERVGDDGVTLTQAGYLPPVHVEAAFTELEFDKMWIGASNREDLTYPVLHLRQSAQQVGLLRKHRGRLLATTRGKALRSDPVGLWWHLAERTPVGSADRCVYDAGLLCLAALAAETTDNVETIVAELLDALGVDGRRRLHDHRAVGGSRHLRRQGHTAPAGLLTCTIWPRPTGAADQKRVRLRPCRAHGLAIIRLAVDPQRIQNPLGRGVCGRAFELGDKSSLVCLLFRSALSASGDGASATIAGIVGDANGQVTSSYSTCSNS
ncbi:hypothetical protein [Mycobacterium sp.]|uniref:hypothetical protein n=1 Tax=Mycobacterium sp. TaxID=1785 RepID=UPI0031E24566